MINRTLITVLAILMSTFAIMAQVDDGNTYLTAERLFHISRSANKNLVCYDVNMDGDKLNLKEPLNVYWVNREKHPGETNGLSFIQRKMAYGYKLVKAGEDSCICSLTAYPSRELTLAKHGGKYVCFITINGKKAILRSLYVKANPKNPLSVEYVELRGVNLSDNSYITERVAR